MTRHIVQIDKSTIQYDADTGEFVWVIARRKPSLTGKRADVALANGYRYIRAGGKTYSASRLAYTLAHGVIPEGMEIDHINRINDDNRASNLRIVTREQNLSNRVFGENACGYTGVSFFPPRRLFRARFKGRVAYFKTAEEASEHYKKIKAEYDAKIFGKAVPSGSSSIQEPDDEPTDASIGDDWDYDPYYRPRSGLPR